MCSTVKKNNVSIRSFGINHPLSDDRVVTIAERIDTRLTVLPNDTPESIEFHPNGTTSSPATHVLSNVRDNLFADLERPIDFETLKRLKALESTR